MNNSALRVALGMAVASIATPAIGAPPAAARAEPVQPVAPSPEDPRVAEARAAFISGAELVKKAQWGEALAAFEISLTLRPHAVTMFNIGACQRAIGHYTLARKALSSALEMSHVSGRDELSESLTIEARGYVSEIDRLLVRATITLAPREAAIAIDGRPLEANGTTPSGTPRLVSGVKSPGRGEPAPAAVFEVLLNPGAHVITLSRKGFGDAVVNRTFTPAQVTPLKLELDRLPATLHIASSVEGAIVTVNGADVGPTPVDVLRPGGSYQIIVKKKGYVTYETRVMVEPGQQSDLRAPLLVEKKSLAERWWFWTAIGTAVTGGVVATYFATRPAPTRPAVDCGSLSWCAKVP